MDYKNLYYFDGFLFSKNENNSFEKIKRFDSDEDTFQSSIAACVLEDELTNSVKLSDFLDEEQINALFRLYTSVIKSQRKEVGKYVTTTYNITKPNLENYSLFKFICEGLK